MDGASRYVFARPFHADQQSLLTAFLAPFKAHVAALHAALETTPRWPGPPMHPDVPEARLAFLHELLPLTYNLLRWGVYWTGRLAPAWSASDRGTYVGVVDELLDAVVGRVLLPVQEFAEPAAREMAQAITARMPQGLPEAVGAPVRQLAQQ